MIRANNLGGTEARTVLASGGLWVIPSRLAGHSLLRSLGLLPVGVEVWHLRLLCFFFTLISLALFAVSASRGAGRRSPVGWRPAPG